MDVKEYKAYLNSFPGLSTGRKRDQLIRGEVLDISLRQTDDVIVVDPDSAYCEILKKGNGLDKTVTIDYLERETIMNYLKDRNTLIKLIRNYPCMSTADAENLLDSIAEDLADYIIAGVENVSRSIRESNVLEEMDLSLYADRGFDELQMQEISVGVESKLSAEQVDMFAKPEFNHYQMREIRIGFFNGLDFVKVSVYAKPEFTVEQMNVIRVGFELGMTHEEIAVLAKPEFSWQKMFQIRNKIRSGDMHVPLNTIISKAKNQKSDFRENPKHEELCK